MVSIGRSSASCAISRLLFIGAPSLGCARGRGYGVCESSVAHRGRGELGYELVLIEPLQLERLDQVRSSTGRRKLGQRLADDRRRLEAVRPPAGADVEALDLRLAEDRRVVGREVAQ